MALKVKKTSSDSETKDIHCGIIMPISTMEDCTEQHWRDVRLIIEDAIASVNEPKFSVGLVSDALDTGVIHKRIVENVYLSDIVVCDVSCRNPNVMFELGMRIAFDKTVVVIKDDKTDRSFDTGTIESISYPRSLRFPEIVEFKKQLAQKVVHTYLTSQKGDYTSILRSSGSFEVAKVEEEEVSPETLAIRDIQRNVAVLMAHAEDERRTRLAKKPNFIIEKKISNVFDTDWESISGNNLRTALRGRTLVEQLGDDSVDSATNNGSDEQPK